MVNRATTTELGKTREEVVETAVRKLELSSKSASQAYDLAEQNEAQSQLDLGLRPRAYRLSQQTPWQDGRFALDRAAGGLLATVN